MIGKNYNSKEIQIYTHDDSCACVCLCVYKTRQHSWLEKRYLPRSHGTLPCVQRKATQFGGGGGHCSCHHMMSSGHLSK